MEENMNMTEQPTQAEEMGNEPEVQEGEAVAQEPEKEPGKSKLFTQEEVNVFVQNRVNKIRSLAVKEAQAECDQRLAALEAREMKLTVKEALSARDMPKELADIITCTDEKDLDNKLEALQKIYGNNAKNKEKPTGFMQVGAGNGECGFTAIDPVRKAMGLE